LLGSGWKTFKVKKLVYQIVFSVDSRMRVQQTCPIVPRLLLSGAPCSGI